MLRAPVIAVDLGSAWVRGSLNGDRVSVPGAVARRVRPSGVTLAALGEDARALHGRAPDSLHLSRPFRGGRVSDPAAGVALGRELLRRLGAPRRFRLAMPIDDDAPTAARDELLALASRLGDPSATLIPHAIAAMRGAGLPGGMPAAMVVDVGESRTQVAVLAEDAATATATFEIGGETWDGAIVRYLRREHALQIGPAMAERLKLTVGPSIAAGRCLRRGAPRAQPLHAGELELAHSEVLVAMAAAIRRVLEATPAAIAEQVIAQGILLVGGGATLAGLDAGLRRETGLAFMVAEQPAEAVLRGIALCAPLS